MRVSEAVEHYLHAKRQNGLAYETEGAILSSFRRFANNPFLIEVTTKQILDFLNIRRCSTGRWMTKHGCLRMFFEFWSDRGHMQEIKLPEPKRIGIGRIASPCIYTRIELRRLIQATHEKQAHWNYPVGAATFRTILLTLYGTGARTGEIFWLQRGDLDLKQNLIFLRGDRKIHPRRIPLNRDLNEELSNYLRSGEGRNKIATPYVFVSKRGKPLQARSMFAAFARLRTRAGVVGGDASLRKPSMGDLRQTFAVHRITSWIQEGVDLNRMLPALSAYMGLSDISSIQRFLRMTPERFRRELDELSPYKSRKRWCDKPELMTFLDGLRCGRIETNRPVS